MRKIMIVAAAAVFALMPLKANAGKGEATVGVQGGFNTETNSALAGIYLQYQCNEWLRLSPDVQALVRNDNWSAFQINGNAHFLIPLNDRVTFYPLAGVTYQGWRYSSPEPDLYDGKSSYNRFGVNAGLGFETKLTPTLKLSVEGKYSAVKDFSSGNFYMGIGYVF